MRRKRKRKRREVMKKQRNISRRKLIYKMRI